MRSPSSTLLASIATIDRRLVIRRMLLGASLGALAGAPALALGRYGVLVVIALAGFAGWLARNRAPRSAAWLAHHDRSEDLIVSAVAVVDGTTRRTALADRVVTFGARAAATTRPSLVPALLATLAITTAVLALVIAVKPSHAPRAVSIDDRAAQMHVAEGASTDVVDESDEPLAADLVDGAIETPSPASSPTAERDRARAGQQGSGRGSSSRDDGPGGVGSGASMTGSGDAPLSSRDVVAGSSNAKLETSAPLAGAGAELLAVPPRYRALVRSFLETK